MVATKTAAPSRKSVVSISTSRVSPTSGDVHISMGGLAMPAASWGCKPVDTLQTPAMAQKASIGADWEWQKTSEQLTEATLNSDKPSEMDCPNSFATNDLQEHFVPVNFDPMIQQAQCPVPASQESPTELNAMVRPSGLQDIREKVDSLNGSPELLSMKPIDHWTWATQLPLSSELREIPEDQRVIASFALDHTPAELHEKRQSAMMYWAERKEALTAPWSALYEKLPAHVQSVIGPHKNILLLRELLEASGSPDIMLCSNLMGGFPLTGQLPRSGTLKKVSHKECTISADALRAQAWQRNQSMVNRVANSSSDDPVVTKQAMNLTDTEVAEGKAWWLKLRKAVAHAVLSPRFAIDQGVKMKAGALRRKVRLIDDFTASMVNSTVSAGERISHDYLDQLIGLIQLFSSAGERVSLRKDDIVGAYKTLPLQLEELDLAVAATKAVNGDVKALQLLCCPFGAIGSVHAWHRVGAALQTIMAKVFYLPYLRYVDDFFAADINQNAQIEFPFSDFSCPVGAADLARWVMQFLLGWDLDTDKEVTAENDMSVLGVEVAVLESSVKLHISSKKITG